MIVLIDNGHGANTPGKCSPDGRIKEYAWARQTAMMLEDALKARGIEAVRITPEKDDVQIRERVRRVNGYCAKYGSKNCLCISLHLNAAGCDGKWHTASGWSGWVAPNASSKSKRFAKIAHEEAEKRGLKGNRAVMECRCWTGNFGIVRDTNCPAVLTENLFQDNKDEVDYLLSQEGRQAIVDLHVAAVERYKEEYGI